MRKILIMMLVAIFALSACTFTACDFGLGGKSSDDEGGSTTVQSGASADTSAGSSVSASAGQSASQSGMGSDDS